MFIWMPPIEAPDSRPAPGMEPENPPSAPDFFVLPDSVPLRTIRDFAEMPLRWVQLKNGFRTYVLRCGEEILGLVRCEFKWWGGPRGLARTKQGTWSFGGYGAEVEIETEKGDRTLVRPYRAGPTLSFPNGHDYFLMSRRGRLFIATDYMWLAADNTPLVTFSVRHRAS